MTAEIILNEVPGVKILSKSSSNLLRLQKFLAGAGVCSRRRAEKLILQGRVKVDGETVTRLGTRIDAERQQVTLDGKRVLPGAGGHLYLILNKPRGILTTLSDPYGRPTISDLLRDISRRIYPVGRLDMDSEGLLFLTDNGELAHRLLHPSFKVQKRYVVTVGGIPSKRDLDKLRSGVAIGEGILTRPCIIRLIGKKKRQALLEVLLTEGRKRQIRLMFKTIGHPVLKLKRTAMGPLKLGDLKPGTYRRLCTEEIKKLKEAAGLI